MVRPCFLQELVPPRLAAILIHRRRVKAKIAYQELIGAIQAEGGGGGLCWRDRMDTSSLHCPKRRGSTQHGPQRGARFRTGHPSAGSARLRGGKGGRGPASLVAPERSSAWYNGGPGRRHPGRSHQREVPANAPGEEPGEITPKSVAEAYRETYRTLLRFNNVGSVDALTPLWSRLANCHKSE